MPAPDFHAALSAICIEIIICCRVAARPLLVSRPAAADGGDPLHENLNGCAARVVGRIDWIKSEARKSKIEGLDKSARSKVVGDDNIAE